MKLFIAQHSIPLYAIPVGSLFEYHGTIALKTEYRTNDYIDAYIIGSGERFIGAAKTPVEQRNIEVHQVTLTPLSDDKEIEEDVEFFRTQLANEMTRGELTDRCCELYRDNRELRHEWLNRKLAE